MTPADRADLIRELKVAEGKRLKPYTDTVGKLTIGYGRNLSDKGISDLEAEILLTHDAAESEKQCWTAYPWFASLSARRQMAIVELVFNMGLKTFNEFTNTQAQIRAGNFENAARQLLASKWAAQVGPTRSRRVAEWLRVG